MRPEPRQQHSPGFARAGPRSPCCERKGERPPSDNVNRLRVNTRFISERFARKQKMKTKIVEEVLKVALADRSTSSRPLETTDARLAVGGYGDDQRLTVFPLDRYDVILGKPWLTRNNPAINYHTNEVKLGAESLITGEPTGDAAVPSELMFISGRQARHALQQGREGYLAIFPRRQFVT